MLSWVAIIPSETNKTRSAVAKFLLFLILKAEIINASKMSKLDGSLKNYSIEAGCFQKFFSETFAFFEKNKTINFG
jgi:hypothetical protein